MHACIENLQAYNAFERKISWQRPIFGSRLAASTFAGNQALPTKSFPLRRLYVAIVSTWRFHLHDFSYLSTVDAKVLIIPPPLIPGGLDLPRTQDGNILRTNRDQHQRAELRGTAAVPGFACSFLCCSRELDHAAVPLLCCAVDREIILTKFLF